VGSKNAPQRSATEFAPERLLDVEAHLLEIEIFLNALLTRIRDRRAFLQEIELDMAAWSERKTLAAQSELAMRARARVVARIHALLENPRREVVQGKQRH
jgi:hypothetical protein